jgi:hypothetical protein
MLAASSTTLLLVSGCGSGLGKSVPIPASEAALNIGFVLYTESGAPGTLNALWKFANANSGPGVAAGGPATGGFAERYHLRYFLESGEFSDEYDLVIERHKGGDFYDVTYRWILEHQDYTQSVRCPEPLLAADRRRAAANALYGVPSR